MAGKSDFTAEEWSKIRDSVMMTGIAVSMAEPSGLVGMLQEGAASARAMLAAKNDGAAPDLVKAIVADMETSEGRSATRGDLGTLLKGKKPAEARAAAIAALGEAVALVEAKAPWEADSFKRWIQALATNVAEAAKEGGFLGFGGTPVSDAERATVADITRAIRL